MEFSKLTDIKPELQEAQKTLSKINNKITISRHIIFKLQEKKKQTILKEHRENIISIEAQR